jgi:cytochrome c oxidase assembly protein subunit 15
MWLVWWATHLPAVRAPAAVTLPTLLITQMGVLIALARHAGPTGAPGVGLGGGVVAAMLNLLIVGSVLGEQAGSTGELADAANRFRDEAPVILVGFLLASAAAGVASGFLARPFASREGDLDPHRWLGRHAGVLAIAFIPLLAVGGSVTSTESGMAVPDAVTTYGSVSFLFPISLMAEPRIFLEHTHRLFGALLGLASILFAVQTLVARAPLRARAMGWTLVVLVTLQGLLGITRVSLVVRGWPGFSAIPEPVWAALHGITGQGVFAFAVWTAAVTSARVLEPTLPARTIATARRAGNLGGLCVVALFIQLTFGALSRHTGSAHALWSHVGWSLVVTIGIVVLAALLGLADRYSERGSQLRGIGRGLLVTVSVQVILGFAALALVGQGGGERAIPTADELATAAPIDTTEALFTTAHQTTGAVLLALTVLGATRARWVGRRTPGSA